jgi:hypothetical protein
MKDPFKDIDQVFKDAVDHSSDSEIDAKLIDSAKARSEYERVRDEDTVLQQAKETYKELARPYKDDIKAAALRIKYCIHVLKGRGKV